MTNDTIRDFAAIQRLAYHLEERLHYLGDKLHGTHKGWQWEEREKACFAVGKALDLIARTPNACINAEALAAFDAVLEEAHEALTDWCEDLLTPDAEPTEQAEQSRGAAQLDDSYIPF